MDADAPATPAAADGTAAALAGLALGGNGGAAPSTAAAAAPGAVASSNAPPIARYSASLRRTALRDLVGAPDGGLSAVGATLTVGGWVRAGREARAGAIAFVELHDGTGPAGLQAVVPAEAAAGLEGGLKAVTPSGTSLLLSGTLAATPPGTQQPIELQVSSILHVGPCDNGKGGYPLAGKKRHTREFLREVAHLRPRTATLGSVARVRSALAAATHAFFQGAGFQYVTTPIITASDCEGAGEMFQVTTLLGKVGGGAHGAPPAAAPAPAPPAPAPPADPAAVAAAEAAVSSAADAVRALKAAAKEGGPGAPTKEDVAAAVADLMTKKATAEAANSPGGGAGGAAGAAAPPSSSGALPMTPAGEVDYTGDFFGKPAFLTVSGQLNAEFYACALTNVYTFGPTFRAENSHTARHLAEFWMVEPELAFADLADDMQCAEDFIRSAARSVLASHAADLALLEERLPSPGAVARLRRIADTPFVRMSYTAAVEALIGAVERKEVAFQFPVDWGTDLASEHERWLTETLHGGTPVIVHDYPKAIKAFYMRLNEDGRTVAAMDVLVPGVGELVGGSQREDRLDVLEARIGEAGMPLAPYGPYLDLRRYGTVPHAGFGVGFERLVQFVCGLDNIRDAIPFPRWPGNAAF